MVKNEETLRHIGIIEDLAENGGLGHDQLEIIVEQLTRLKMPAIIPYPVTVIIPFPVPGI